MTSLLTPAVDSGISNPSGMETLDEGAELQLGCVVTGTPSPDVIWTKDNVTISNDERSTIYFSNGRTELSIASVTSQDSGIYRCIATNTASTDAETFTVKVLTGKFGKIGVMLSKPHTRELSLLL